MKFMSTLRNRTQISLKTKDFAQSHSPATSVIPPCCGGTTGKLGGDTGKTNILDCSKKEMAISLLLKINANY